ncbi:MAG TPA: bifunctional demethylmenaquinone methyltransferase/2-methoxy-6-polyprenyl-1,4-benzoquinol methylase UbiE, partial [Thermodesulfobacteriota bacterium]|nr:bifunctional demethylmenaquinone methyltransferase/2-methoxy-6-polyprenyl-1,4-benzoquinol methylase UbiE [Thermodesulfobacteriota bacterium]
YHKAVSERSIRELFDKGAPFYDCTNTFLSLGIDDIWRKALARSIEKKDSGLIVDIATGTAKVAISIARENPHINVVGIDFSAPMVEKGAQRVKKEKFGSRIDLVVGDGCALPLPQESVDAVTIAFGIRNIPRREKALEEFFTVLKPGGQLIVIEFGFPSQPILQRLYTFYFDHILPRVGSRLMRVDGAYSYLRDSVHAFPSPEAFMQMIRAAGFSEVAVRPLTGGIVNMFLARKQ